MLKILAIPTIFCLILALQAKTVIPKTGNVSDKMREAIIQKLPHNNSKDVDWNFKGKKRSAITIIPKSHDWSKYQSIEFKIYSGRANKDKINIKIDSELNGAIKGNYYRYKLNIDWKGWKIIRLPFKHFRASKASVGWNQIDRIQIFNYGWGISPHPGQNILIESIKLLKDNKLSKKKQNYRQIHSRLTPVTMGDAVIEPFFDSAFEAWSQWHIRGDNINFSALQRWLCMRISWTSTAANDGPVLTREYPQKGIFIYPYSQLVISAGLQPGSTLEIKVETDNKIFTKKIPVAKSHTAQYVVPIPNSKYIKKIEISITSTFPGVATGKLFWIGVRDPSQVKYARRRWEYFSRQPLDIFLYDKTKNITPKPIYNLLTNSKAFEQASKIAYAKNKDPLGIQSQITLKHHIGGANSKLFGRENESYASLNKLVTGKGKAISLIKAAVQSALIKDKQSLREIAKAAVQIALIPHWDVDFITDFPGSSWTQGSFQQSMTCYQLAVALDLSGAWLTRAGKDLIIRRLVEHGLGNINYDLWKTRYRHYSNQLPVFSMGRLAVYALMEKHYWSKKLIEPYTDLAFKELNATLARIFNSDGGFFEGSAYLSYTLNLTLPALALYANARNKSLNELLPPLLKRTDDYIAALRSTTNGGKYLVFISSGQGGPQMSVTCSVLSIIAKLHPSGAAARMLASTKKANRKYQLWALPAPNLDKVNPDYYVPFVKLPISGLTASSRKLAGEWTKLIIIGNSTGNGHYHEDRGSFVLEFAGETFAADPGGISYSNVNSDTVGFAQNHNMLVPIQEGKKRPAPILPYRIAVIPKANGNETAFNAKIIPHTLWPTYYKKWIRTFNSPSPDKIVITDEYQLKSSSGVEFRWQTPLPVKKQNGIVIIEGKKGIVAITPPKDTNISIIPHRQLGNWSLATIVFTYKKPHGILSTTVKLNKK